MHPLLKRLLVRGPFMFLVTAGIGLLFAMLLRWMVTSGNPNLTEGGNPPGHVVVGVNSALDGGIDYNGPLVFGVIGFSIYAILESLTYVKERLRK